MHQTAGQERYVAKRFFNGFYFIDGGARDTLEFPDGSPRQTKRFGYGFF
jgi:hypothetical protein